jgi:hypothetical protein
MNDKQIEALRRLKDFGALPPRDPSHETAPYIEPPEKTGADLIADKAIAVLDQTLHHALSKIPPLRERLDQVEQTLIQAGVDGRETIRNLVHVAEVSLKVIEQIDQQINEAVKPLTNINRG